MLATFFLLVAMHGFFMAVVLYFGSTEDRAANRVLGHLTAALSSIILLHSLGVAGVRQHLPQLRDVDLALWLLFAPLTYSYVRRLCGRDRSRGEVLLYLPFSASALTLLAVHNLSGAEGLQTGGVLGQYGFAAAIPFTGLFTLVTSVSVVLSRKILARALAEADDSEPRRWRYRWLRRLLAVIAFYAAQDSLFGTIFSYYGSYPSWLLTVSFLGYCLLIYGIGYLMVAHREGFVKPISEAVRQKVRSSSSEEDQVKDSVARLRAVMRLESLYRQEDLSLEALAQRLEMSRHHLSRLINQQMGVSFHDFVNLYRIEEVKARLLSETGTRGVLEIAEEAGFGSRASFYRAFKKHTGLTPRQFLLRRDSPFSSESTPFPLEFEQKKGPEGPWLDSFVSESGHGSEPQPGP